MHGLFPGLSLGSDRCTVGADRAAGAGTEHPRAWHSRGPPAEVLPPPHHRRAVVRGSDGLFLAAVAARLPALADRLLLLPALGRRRHHRPDPRHAVRDAAGRDPMASAGAVDSQTVPGGATVGKNSR